MRRILYSTSAIVTGVCVAVLIALEYYRVAAGHYDPSDIFTVALILAGVGVAIAITGATIIKVLYEKDDKAASRTNKELADASGWLARFVMKFYIQAEHPTYEKMKALYQELDTFQRALDEKVLTKKENNGTR